MLRLVSFLIVILHVTISNAQIDTEFWFAAPEATSLHADSPIYLRVSTMELAATVTVSQPANPAFTPIRIQIPSNNTESINLTSRINDIENLTPNTVLNKGLLIKSTALITAYYEVLGTDQQYGIVNCDIFSLKGRNALGTRFYTPFQNYWSNYPGINAWASFDIVATEDGTVVTITPTKDLVGHAAGIPFTINLDKGQTYSAQSTHIDGPNHPSGSLITSNKPIAVTIKDDSLLESSNWDLAGDQIIPVDLTGQEYVVIKASGTLSIDRIFICATENATEIYLNGSTTSIAILQAGETFMYQLNLNYEHVLSSKPVYIFHMSGFTSEIAGALLPPIGCTGSKQIGFTRPTSETFALNIVVKTGGEHYFKFNGSTSLIRTSDFDTVPGTGGLWKAANILFSESVVPSNVANTLKNDSTDFHLGILNGGYNTGFRYGYFSDYGVVELGVDRSICKGDSITFNGGFGMSSYLWSTSETTQYITVKDSGTYWIKIKKGSCILKDSIDSVSVFFHPNPRKVLGTDTTVCSNTGYTIKMDTLYTNYIWQNGSKNSTYTPTISGTQTYWVEVANQFGCTERDSIDVRINLSPRPTIYFENDLEKICWDSTIVLSADQGFQSYRWQGGETTSAITTPHLSEYQVVVTDINNCTDSTNLSIDCSPYIKVYNLFTPNGDGQNDVFFIEGLKPNKWILEVYNKWGGRVYYNRNYDNTFEGYNLSSGVYLYSLKHIENKKTIKGWVHILK